MKHITKRPLYLLAIGLLIVLFLIGIFFASRPDTPKVYTVSVILQDSSSAEWKPFITGLRAAAEENNIRLSIAKTERIGSIRDEKVLAEEEIRNGADAVIAELCTSYQTDTFTGDISGTVPLLLINNSPLHYNEQRNIGFLSPDNTGMGAAALTLLENDFSDLNGMKVGIVAGNDTTIATKERIDGLTTAMYAQGMKVAWTLYKNNAPLENITDNQIAEKADVIIALDNDGLERAINYRISHKLDTTPIYGIGASEKCIYNLDHGLVAGMIVPSQFDLGYNSIIQISDRLRNGRSLYADSVLYSSVTRENLFSEKNQKLLFPINP